MNFVLIRHSILG